MFNGIDCMVTKTLQIVKKISMYAIFIMLVFGAGTVIHGAFTKEKTKKTPSIGLAEVKGVITSSEEVIKDLKFLEKDDMVKAIVLRVDSPGGVVGPSQEIHDEVERIAKKKYIIVSMGSIAASGGYYISAPATTILANPGTLTGSIGVILKLSNIQKLLGKIGMEMTTIKSGEMKAISDPTEAMTPAKKAALQALVNDSHEQFVEAVANGREMEKADVQALADGRVYTGRQALELGLVDKLGGLEAAIKEAAVLAELKEGDVHIIKPPKEKKTILDYLDSTNNERGIAKTAVELLGMRLLMQ